MATNEIFDDQILSVVVTDPAIPTAGDPCRYGFATGVAVTDEGGGGNPAGSTSVDFGLKVWTLPVTDSVGGGIAVGDTLFYSDANDDVRNDSSGYFFGFALQAVGVGLTVTIRVLHVPAPGSGTLGAGTIATANLANGILSADAAGQGKVAANFFDEATVLAKFGTDSIDNAELLKIIKNGAFLADAATRALFASGIWTQAYLAANGMDGTIAANVADANVIGGLLVVHRIDIADAATGDVDVVLTHKERVINAWAVKTANAGGAANTVQLQTGAAAA